jgi:hypothetical protein
MTRYEDEVAAVAVTYRDARELMGSEATALKLARQCYNDLWPGHPPEQVGREVEQIVRPVRAALATGRSWRPWHR